MIVNGKNPGSSQIESPNPSNMIYIICQGKVMGGDILVSLSTNLQDYDTPISAALDT